MPINYALLLCVPIGLLAYFEARWMIRFLLGRYGQRERRAAQLVGAYGALIIPLIYLCRVTGNAFSGRIGKFITPVMFGLISAVFALPMFRVLFERVRGDVRHH